MARNPPLPPVADADPEAALDCAGREQVLAALRALPGSAPMPPSPRWPSERALADLDAFSRHLSLTDEERLILRLVYQDGLSARAAARALGAPERTIQRGRGRALAKIAAAFAAAGTSDPPDSLLAD